MPDTSDFPHHDTPAQALFVSLWIVIYLILEFVALTAVPTEVSGALFRFGAMFPFFLMTIGYHQLLKPIAPRTILSYAIVNCIGVIVHVASIPALLETNPDTTNYDLGLLIAETLMSSAIYVLAWVLYQTPIVPKFISIAYFAFGFLWQGALIVWKLGYEPWLDWPTDFTGGFAQGSLAIALSIFAIRSYKERLKV